MKKLIVSIIAFLYITSSCEATVYLHYCMGKQVSFSFEADHSRSCHQCGMKKSAKGMGCCRDEKKVVKTDPNHGLPAVYYSTNTPVKIILFSAEYHSYSEPVLVSNMNASFAHGPPGDHPVPFYLMNCLLLI